MTVRPIRIDSNVWGNSRKVQTAVWLNEFIATGMVEVRSLAESFNQPAPKDEAMLAAHRLLERVTIISPEQLLS